MAERNLGMGIFQNLQKRDVAELYPKRAIFSKSLFENKVISIDIQKIYFETLSFKTLNI